MAGSQAVKELNKMGTSAKNMSALEVAALGKLMASSGSVVKLEMDAEDEYWKAIASRAKRGGPGSWFASKVDFSLNGAHFLGKVGYSVRGGVVPLFDGAAIDLESASLESVKPKKAKPDPRLGNPAAYKNWIVGRGGLLVLAPVGADNVVPMRAGEVVITEKGLVATAERPMDFRMGQKEVHGERLEFSDQVAVLYGVTVREKGEDVSDHYRTEAAIDGEGISLYEKPAPAETPARTAIPPREANLVDKLAVTAIEYFEKTEEEGESDPESKLKFNKKEGTLSFTHTGDEVSSEEEAPDPIWTKLLNGLMDTEKDTVLDALRTGADTLDWDEVGKVFAEQWEKVRAIYDGCTSEELIESWRIFPDQVTNLFRGNLKEEGDIKSYLEKLVPTGPISDFLGLNEGETVEGDGGEKADGSLHIPLAKIPLFLVPLISFAVDLTPAYSFIPYFRAEAENIYSLWKGEEQSPMKLTFRAGVKATLSLKAAANLTAEIPFIIKGSGGIYAAAGLKGGGVTPGTGVDRASDFGENVALEMRAELPIKRNTDGTFGQAGDAEAKILGGFQLIGTVGAEVKLSSSLLMWEHTLLEQKFAEWKLGAIGLTLGVKKKPADSLFKGWSLDEASIKIGGPGDGIGKAFLEENTEENRYGLYNKDPVDSKKYSDISTNFDTAMQLLDDYVNGKAKGGLIIPTESAGGLSNTISQMELVQSQFVKVWVEAQNELESMKQAMGEKELSKKEKKKVRDAMKSLETHTKRIQYMEEWTPEKGDVMSYYTAEASRPGMGYLDSLEKQAEVQTISYEAIVDYERGRYKELTKDSAARIGLVREMVEKNVYSEKAIYDAYIDKGGKDIKNHKSLFQDTATLLTYEQQRQRESAEKASERKRKVMANTTEKKKASFFTEYVKLLSEDDLLSYGNPEWLLRYEGQAMRDKSGQEGKDYDAIKNPLGEDRQAGFAGAAIQQIREREKGYFARTVPSLMEVFGKELYRTATVDDLLELEMNLHVMGEEGKALEAYLSPQKAAGGENKKEKKDQDPLTSAFGGNKKQALERFSAYLDESETLDLLPHLTIELLLEYAERPQKLSEEEQEKKKEEIQYLERGLLELQAVGKISPDEVHKTEQQYIAGYFLRYYKTRRAYISSLKKGEQVNLPLMMAALSDGSKNPRYAMLLEAKEQGLPDFKVLTQYIAAGGDVDEISEHQRQKYGENGLTPEAAGRYYESMLSTKKHFIRYYELKSLREKGASYEQMLEAYKKLKDGGKNYSLRIKDDLRKGQLDGTPITIEEILKREAEVFNAATAKHTNRIALISDMKDRGAGYQEILSAYEAQEATDGEGTGAKIKSFLRSHVGMEFETGFEKSLKEEQRSPQQIIDFETMQMERAGAKHADRLRALLGLAPDSPDFETAGYLSDEKEREEKRLEYLATAKAFKKSRETKKNVQETTNVLLNRGDTVVRESILSYERGRKAYYDSQFKDILDSYQRIKDMQDRLSAIIGICDEVMPNMDSIKKNPAAVFDRYRQLKESQEFITMQRNQVEETVSEKNQILTEAQRMMRKAEEEDR